MPSIQLLNPDSLGKPFGQYSHITRVKASEFLFIAGQVGADRDGRTPADFDAQCAQVFANLGAALASQGASFANVVAFTAYLVHWYTRRTSRNSCNTARASSRACSPAAPIRPTRCSSSTGWCGRSF
jgi:enamine deaminase RidA (YjgF/YER057c/UK114 family)